MFNNQNSKEMETNFQITAVKKELKNGQNGFEVYAEGMDNKLSCARTFSQPRQAMKYMFWLSKQLDLQIDSIKLAAVSIAYQRVKAAEAKIVENAQEAIADYDEAEAESDGSADVEAEAPAVEQTTTEEVKTSTPESESPMLKQFKTLKQKHPDALLLFRCGDFMETYCQDAVDAANILGITLTRRSGDKNSIEIAGFPHHALDTYLPKLIRAGRRVAICDQIEEPKAPAKKPITELVSDSAPKKRGRKPKTAQVSDLFAPAMEQTEESREAV